MERCIQLRSTAYLYHLFLLKHTTFGGFKPEYFSAFESSMSLIWSRELGSKYTSQCEKSWCKLFAFIMQVFTREYKIS